jgi:hypothetical protein
MGHKAYVLAVVLMAAAFVHAQPSESLPLSDALAQELAVVRGILNANGFSAIAESSVCVIREGHVRELRLINPEVAKDGYTVISPLIGTLSELRSLTIKNNSIHELPEELCNLHKLEELDLGNNELYSLPVAIGDLVYLKKLDVQHNELRSLPASLFTLPKLWFLRMWGNELTVLPEQLGALPMLKELYLGKNRLKSLPDAVMTMKHLTYIDFDENSLCDISPKLDEWLRSKEKRYRELQRCN